MKGLLCVFACLALSQAQSDIDWSNVRAPHIDDVLGFHDVPSGRIVGGEEVTPNSIPYQAGLLITTEKGVMFCGGSLISKRYVLTAAHCVDAASQIEVVLGAHKIRVNEPTQVRMTTTEFLHHPEWNKLRLVNDIALVKLPKEVTLSKEIQIIALPTHSDKGKTFEGEQSLGSGWGKDSDKAETIAEALRSVKTEVMTNKACNLRFLGIIQDTHLCTSGSGGKGACSGDSGGPTVVGNKQVGLVSFGLSIGCEKGWPSVFTRITSYLDWIEKNSDVVIQN